MGNADLSSKTFKKQYARTEIGEQVKFATPPRSMMDEQSRDVCEESPKRFEAREFLFFPVLVQFLPSHKELHAATEPTRIEATHELDWTTEVAFQPQPNPQTLISCTISAYSSSPRGFVSRLKPNAGRLTRRKSRFHSRGRHVNRGRRTRMCAEGGT